MATWWPRRRASARRIEVDGPAAYGVRAMPSSYLVDAQGRVAFVEYGFKDDRKAELERQIAAALTAR